MRSVGKKVLHLVPVLFLVTAMAFLLLELLPGDPAELLLANSEASTEEEIERFREKLGLNDPVPVRYVQWVGDAVTGDLGRSYRTQQSVTEAIGQRLPVSLELMVTAELIALALAVPAALASAYRRDGPLDRVTGAVGFGLQSIPNFMMSLLLIYFFSVTLGWFPATGYVRVSEDVWQNLRSVALPSLTLAAGLFPVYLRVLRNDVLTTLTEDHVLLARAAGLSPRTILVRYALRPSSLTLVTLVGINVGALVGGSVIVEQIFGLPGLGSLLFAGITTQDYLMVQGVVLVIAVGYVMVNFFVDLLYTVLDPRVRT